MPPLMDAKSSTISPTGVLFEHDTLDHHPQLQAEVQNDQIHRPYRRQIVWLNVLQFAYLHGAALYGFYLIFTSSKIATTIFALVLGEVAFFGITAGVHRLWSHRAYKAKLPLRVLLMIFNTICYQNHIYEWARDHRVHHKFTETDADPHNAKRGLFFSHIGWLMVRKHQDVKTKGQTVDMSDLERDPVVMFQKKYYGVLVPLLCFILPTVIPIYCWDETLSNAWYVATMFRYVWILNATWLVNSAAHAWGNKPYEKGILAAENLAVSIGALGEGWHNYHHIFPWDYKTSELGKYRANLTTAFIDFFAKVGWAYDLKTVPSDMVQKRVERTGDGSHEIWGWGDKDMPKDLKTKIKIINGKMR